MINLNSFKAFNERRLLFRRKDPERKEVVAADSEQVEKQVSLVKATKELLDIKAGPRKLRASINRYLEKAKEKPAAWNKWLKDGMDKVLQRYDEIKTQGVEDWKQSKFEGRSELETKLIAEMNDKFNTYESVEQFASELGLVSEEAVEYVSKQQEVPMEDGKSETNLEKNYDTFDEYLEALQKQAKAESETADDSPGESLGDMPVQADEKVSQADKDLLDKLFVDYYKKDDKEKTKTEVEDKEKENSEEKQVETKEQISLPDMKERISLSKRKYIDKCNSLIEKNKNWKTFSADELDAMSADLSDMDEFMNVFDADLAVAKDLEGFNNDSAFTRKVVALSASIKDWQNYVRNMPPKLEGRKEELIAERKAEEELSEKKELALKRKGQVKDIRKNFSRDSREIRDRFNSRAELDKKGVVVLKVDVEQFRTTLGAHKNILSEVKDLAVEGSVVDLQSECEKLIDSVGDWEAYASNSIGELEGMLAGIKAEREKKEKEEKEEAERRLAKEKEQKELDEKKELALKREGQVKDVRNNFSRNSREIRDRYNDRAKLDENNVRILKVDMDQFRLGLDVYKNTLTEVSELAKEGQVADLQGECDELLGSAEAWDSYASNCIGELEGMLAGMEAERKKKEREEEERRLAEEKEKAEKPIREAIELAKNLRKEFAIEIKDIKSRYDGRNTLNASGLEKLKADIALTNASLERKFKALEEVKSLADKKGKSDLQKECADLQKNINEWNTYIADTALMRVNNDIIDARLYDLRQGPRITEEQRVIKRLAVMREHRESLRTHPESGKFNFEKPGDKLTAVLIGANGEKIKSFGRERRTGMSEAEYQAKFERTITTPELFEKYEELFLDPYHDESPDKPSEALLTSMRLWGKEVCGVAAKERELERKFNVNLITENDWITKSTSQLSSVKDLQSQLSNIEQALCMMPKQLWKNTRRPNIYLKNNFQMLEEGGKSKAVYGLQYEDNVVINLSKSPEDVRITTLHELFHLIDYYGGSLGYADENEGWTKLSGDKYTDTEWSKVEDAEARGFASKWAMINADEDQAETFGQMISSPEKYKSLMAWGKKVPELGEKIVLMKQFLHKVSGGHMNEKFWKEFEEGKVKIDAEYWKKMAESTNA